MTACPICGKSVESFPCIPLCPGPHHITPEEDAVASRIVALEKENAVLRLKLEASQEALKEVMNEHADTLAGLIAYWQDTEARAADFHTVYQVEAHRRGDVRHPDDYAELSEASKEYDRVLARWVAAAMAAQWGR